MSQEHPPIRSRRELRQARDERLDANQETGARGPGAVRPASDGPASNGSASNVPASNDPAGKTPAVTVDPGEPTEAEVTGRRRIPGPPDSIRSTAGPERTSQVRARDRATLRTIKELAEKEGNLAGGGPLTRRQHRLLQLAAETAQATSANLTVPDSPRIRATPVIPRLDKAPAAQPGVQGPAGMTVEQALAARELLAQQAKNQLAKMEHINATDPAAVDPDVPAEQIALAEPAAVLNRRAVAQQKLAGQNSTPEPARNDPTTANNLAMVTPLEFVQVPGVERPVMKRPATSHIPIVTNPAPRVEPARKSGNRRPATPPARPKPAAAQSEEDFAGRPPVAANAAYGLDPLDAATAGLGRARRLRVVQVAVLALGLVALIAGITLVITGLAG